MRWLYKLERKLSKFAIKNLMIIISALTLAVFFLMKIFGEWEVASKLILAPGMVAEGQVWRLITFSIIPPTMDPLFLFLTLYFYYMIGTNLEREWGSFRLNIFYFIGLIGTIAAAYITGGETSAVYLNLSLFLAFAKIFPNFEILLFFILPVKVKYLAWLNFAYIGYTVLFDDVPLKIAAVVSLLNYFIFFGKDILEDMKQKRMVNKNRNRYLREVRDAKRNRRY